MGRFLAPLVGVVSVLLLAAAPASALAQDKAAEPVRVGGAIKPPVKIKDAKPVYPDDARRAKAQGVVITEATLGPDGKVLSVKLLRSVPLLGEAAMKAVKEQVYKPTLVNGVAVPIIITVPVIFSLE